MATLKELSTYNAVMMLSGDLGIEPNVLVAIMVENNLRKEFSQFIRGEIKYVTLLDLVNGVC